MVGHSFQFVNMVVIVLERNGERKVNHMAASQIYVIHYYIRYFDEPLRRVQYQ